MRLLTAVVCLLVFTLAAFGQSDRGTITGVISDPAGAVVANAPIESKNTGTGVVSQAASTATGNYTLSQLPAGTYDLSVTVAGFKKFIRTGLVVQALQTLRVDVTLEVGSSAESITVTEATPLLKTESGDVSQNVTSERLNELPLGNAGAVRNPLTIAQLVPGGFVVGANTLRMSGTPVNSQQMRIDGLDATYSLGESTSSFGTPSVDAIQEVAVQTSNFAAEYGLAGGSVFNMTMKSGTNQLHGTVYDYWVNEALFANGAYTHTRAKTRRHDFGGTVGGPIWIPKVYNGRDKTFFFLNIEDRPSTTNSISISDTVPTLDYRLGNFAAATAATANKSLGTDPLGRAIIQNSVYNPASQRVVSATDGRLIRDPYVGNMIPTAQLDPVALKIQALVPLPGCPAGTALTLCNPAGLINNYLNPFSTKSVYYVPSLKFDHSLNSRNKVSFFWGLNHQGTPNEGNIGSSEGFPQPISAFSSTSFVTKSYRLNYDYTLTPTMLLHLGGGYVDANLNMPSYTTDYDVTKQLGLTGPFQPHGFPNISSNLGANSTGGLQALGNTGFMGSQDTLQQKVVTTASLSWVKNNHNYKAGAEARFEGYPNYNIQRTNGLYNFTAAETGLPYLNATGPAGSGGTIGLPYASFLLGLVDNGNVSRPAVAKLGKQVWGFFMQDTWKVTRKLTLDYGLRYDYSTYQREEHGIFGNFSPTTPDANAGGHPGGVIYEATCNCKFSKNYPWAFGPRLGFAYQVNSKTVVRGGAGILYNGTPNNNVVTRQVTSNNVFSSPGFAQPSMILKTGLPLTLAQIAYPNLSPSYYPVGGGTGGGPPFLIDQNGGRPSRSYQYSLGVQREIFKNLAVDASFVGSRGIWWPAAVLVNYNALTPQDLLKNYGLDITNAADRAILAAPIGNTTAGRFQNKLPFAGFPLTQTVAQALRPFPQFNTGLAALWAPLGDTWYSSFQLKVTKRFSHGLDFTYNYTWAKELTLGVEADSVGPFGAAGVVNDVFNRPNNKYISVYSRPQVSNIALNYTLPKGGKNKYLRYAVGDWQFGGLLNYASGVPFAVPGSQNQLATQLFRGTLMNRVPGQPLFLQDLNCHCFDPTKTLTLNPAAWSDPAPGTWGNSTAYYNDFRQQRQPQENITMGRLFRIRESISFEVRAEFTNALNRTRLPNPSAATPLTGPTCFVSGSSGTTGACQTGSTYASGFGFIQTNGLNGARNGQIVARIRF